MNAVLRIFVWLLALSVVALPVVAVVNGWVGAERWPLAKLRVHAAGRAGRPGKTAVGGKRAGAQAVAGRAGSDPGRAQAVRALGPRPPGLRAGQVVPHAEEAGRPGAARTGRPGQPDRRSDEAVQRLACIVRTGRRRCAPGDDGCAWQLVAGAEQRHRSGGRP
ncbi:hypothetical protein G6F32_014266 [Rhizopus arrhizus]|nr:hypothetical protein G6F32_014266 [Rhizopus arrhizus]